MFDRCKAILDDYDAEVAEEELKKWIDDAYVTLVRKYTVHGDERFKFLSEMPFDQGKDWVKKMVDLHSKLNAADPERYPVVTCTDMALAVKAYRKSKKQKTTKLGRAQ